LEILVFDSSEISTALHLEVKCEVINDLSIIDDVLGLTELISKYQKVVFITGIFDLKQKNNLQKIQRQVVNIIDACLFLNKPLYILSLFTPYYGNTQLKTINATSINESSDIDEYSLHLHQIAQEVERGRQEGGLLTFIRSGFDLTKNNQFPSILANAYQWRTFPLVSSTGILTKLKSIIADNINPNINLILVDSFASENDFPEIITNKKGFLYQLKSLFRKEKYNNSLPIELDTLLSKTI
jgi:hypothetical protein